MGFFNSLFTKERKNKDNVTSNSDLDSLKLFDRKEQLKHRKKLEAIADQIEDLEEDIQALSDEELKAKMPKYYAEEEHPEKYKKKSKVVIVQNKEK